MYIAHAAPAKHFAATTKPLWQRRHISGLLSSNTCQQVYKKPYNFSTHTAHCARLTCASIKYEADAHIHDAQSPVAVVPAPQVPVLPLSLLASLSAAWWLTARGSTALQCSTLLLLDIVYAGLHLQPLLPLFQIGRAPDVAFMQSYTKSSYFVSECLLLGWLFSNIVIRASIPTSVLSLHAALHVGFVVLAARAPGWCMQQQVQRINASMLQNGWRVKELAGKWHVLVNMVNFADLALHLCYISILWQSLASTASPNALVQEPWKVAVVGAMLAYLMAHWFPHQQQQQQDHEN